MSRRGAVVTGLLAVAVYLALWIGLVGNWAPMAAADDRTLCHFHDLAAERPEWITFWQGISRALGPTALRLVALAGIVVALLRRNVRVAVFLVLAVLASGLLTLAAKGLSGRPRPATALTYESSTAFPSGHALAIAAAAAAFTTVLWPALSRRGRILTAAGCASLVFIVGLSRVALNVHHPTDVLAGWALGYLWFLLCLSVVVRLTDVPGRRGRTTGRSDGSQPVCPPLSG